MPKVTYTKKHKGKHERDVCVLNREINYKNKSTNEENKYKQKQIFTSNKRVTNRHLKNELNFPNRKKFPGNGARNLVEGWQVYRIAQVV